MKGLNKTDLTSNAKIIYILIVKEIFKEYENSS